MEHLLSPAIGVPIRLTRPHPTLQTPAMRPALAALLLLALTACGSTSGTAASPAPSASEATTTSAPVLLSHEQACQRMARILVNGIKDHEFYVPTLGEASKLGPELSDLAKMTSEPFAGVISKDAAALVPGDPVDMSAAADRAQADARRC